MTSQKKCLVWLLGHAARMYSQCCLALQSVGDLRVGTARMVSQNLLANVFCWCCLAGWCSRAFWGESASGVLLVCSHKCVLLLGSSELISQCKLGEICELWSARTYSQISQKLVVFSSISSLFSPSVPFIPANVYLLKITPNIPLYNTKALETHKKGWIKAL